MAWGIGLACQAPGKVGALNFVFEIEQLSSGGTTLLVFRKFRPVAILEFVWADVIAANGLRLFLGTCRQVGNRQRGEGSIVFFPLKFSFIAVRLHSCGFFFFRSGAVNLYVANS